MMLRNKTRAIVVLVFLSVCAIGILSRHPDPLAVSEPGRGQPMPGQVTGSPGSPPQRAAPAARLLARQDASAAARLAEGIADPALREEALRRTAQLWAACDSPAALAWAVSLPNPEERESALNDVCLKVAEVDPAEAARMRERFMPEDGSGAVLESLAQQWAERDFVAALEWTLGLGEGERRAGLLARLAFIQSQTAPAEAARLVVERIAPGDAQSEAAISVLHQWALRDPVGAGAWVDLFPESALRDRALRELAGIAAFQRRPSAE